MSQNNDLNVPLHPCQIKNYFILTGNTSFGELDKIPDEMFEEQQRIKSAHFFNIIVTQFLFIHVAGISSP